MKQLIFMLLCLVPLCCNAQNNTCKNRVDEVTEHLNFYPHPDVESPAGGIFTIKETKVDNNISSYDITYKTGGKLVSRTIIQGDHSEFGGVNFTITTTDKGKSLNVYIGNAHTGACTYKISCDNNKGFYSKLVSDTY